MSYSTDPAMTYSSFHIPSENIRPFEPTDFASVCQLDAICFPVGIAYPPEEVMRFLADRGAVCYVATDSSRVIAWILGYYRGRGAGHIVTIDVHPDYRRRGIGNALMNRLEAAFRSKGCRVARLEVATDNLGPQAFYQRRGYFTRRTLGQYYVDGGDAYLMELQL